jgi:hypothetical protein
MFDGSASSSSSSSTAAAAAQLVSADPRLALACKRCWQLLTATQTCVAPYCAQPGSPVPQRVTAVRVCRYVKLLHVRGLSQCIVGDVDAHWCDVVKSHEALSLFQQFEARHR